MTEISWTTSTTPVVTVELPYRDGEDPCRVDVEVTSLGTPPSRYSPGDLPEWRVIALEVWVPVNNAWTNLWMAGPGRWDDFPILDQRSDWHKAIEDHIHDEIPTLRAYALHSRI